MSDIVISQLYGGPSSIGATYKDDFIELFNRGTTAVNLNGWKLQYASATNNSAVTNWVKKTILPDFNLQPGQYYLIQETIHSINGVELPVNADLKTIDAEIDLNTTKGKLALLNASLQSVDSIGYGTNSGATPDTGAAPALSATTAALRKEGGFVDTDNNAADFTTGTPNPHNSSQFEHRPTASDKTLSLLEDNTYTFREADFGYQDADGDSLVSVKITGLPTAGTLKLNNTPVQAGDIISVATLDNLKFTPAANVYGNDYAAIHFTVNDGIANSESDNQLIFNVNSVNDAPVSSDKTVSLTEDSHWTFAIADFVFQDLADNPSNSLKNVILIRLPNAGVLQLNGVTLTAADLPNKAISVTDLSNGKLTFQPAADGNGDSYANFDFKVQDDGGTADGGMDISTNTATMTFAVTAVNDAPVASGTATLAAIAANTSNPVGDTVSNLFGSCFSDAKDQVSGGSSANTLTGIAISNYTCDASKGLWQYHYDGLWTTLDNASSTEAILLNANDKLRFVPATHYNGVATSLSANLIESDEIISGQTVDLTEATGGMTHISSATVALNATINPPPAPPPPVPVNHAPTGSVTISGTTEVGQVLVAENTLMDADGLGNMSYQWKVGDTLIPLKSNNYRLIAADIGKTVTVIASYTDGLGKAESMDSSATAAVTAAPIVTPSTPAPIEQTPTPTPPPVSAPIVDTPTAPTPVYEEPAAVVVAPVTPVIPSSFTVDGVTVQQNFTRVYGAEVGHFSTPPILSTRIEDVRTAHPNAADISLGSVNGRAGLSLALPTGVGFQADGVTSPQSLYTEFSQLSDDIQTVLGMDSPAIADGQQFLLQLTSPNQPFFEQKIVLSYDHKTTINQPVIIDGTHTGSSAVLNTFVIDASALPTSSVLELKHVDFAVITGEVNVKLDASTNVVHLASTQTQQTVFSYTGNDTIQVGSGARLFHGGLGTDTVKVAGKLGDYQVNQVFAKITLTSKTNPADMQTLVNVEKIQFTDQTQTFSFDDSIKAIAGTYLQMFGRNADLIGEQYWADAIKNKSLSLGKMALFFMHSAEQLQKIGFDISKADIPTQVEQFYQSFLGREFDPVGKAFWVDKLTTGELNLENLATTVMESAEMQSHYATPTQWDFSI